MSSVHAPPHLISGSCRQVLAMNVGKHFKLRPGPCSLCSFGFRRLRDSQQSQHQEFLPFRGKRHWANQATLLSPLGLPYTVHSQIT